MRFNIRKLEEKGFTVAVGKDAIEIHSAPLANTAWNSTKNVVVEHAGITDPGLQDYVMSAFLVALQRAQILELAE